MSKFKLTKNYLTPDRLLLLGDIFTNSINLLKMPTKCVDFNVLKSSLTRNLELAREVVEIKDVDMTNWTYCHIKAKELLEEFDKLETNFNK